MAVAIIDSGTTNSRVYIVSEHGEVLGVARERVGVTDTARTGNTDALKAGVHQAFHRALLMAKLKETDIRCGAAFGMITSELGLLELSHLDAPAGIPEIAAGIEEVGDRTITSFDFPVFFVRGVRNPVGEAGGSPRGANTLDFMRGEETQAVGYLTSSGNVPVFFTMLSSHTKFVALNGDSQITGSLTTIAGQVFDVLRRETFLSKSISGATNPGTLEPYIGIIKDAIRFSDESGFLRSLFITRFLDTLLQTTPEERYVFFESVVAAEDTKVLPGLAALAPDIGNRYVLVGPPERVQLYSHVIRERDKNAKVESISDQGRIDRLGIDGALRVLQAAGVL